jgi:hypothetical protein
MSNKSLTQMACPICQNDLSFEDGNLSVLKGRSTNFGNKKVLIAKCFHPCTLDPLHYYSYYADARDNSIILIEEMSVNIGARSVLFSNHYFRNKSYIWTSQDSDKIELPFIISPDYPKLTRLISKVKVSIIFG